ncbi:MAG: bifunctional folylpolyglutamate synthase/dihydrofolate synthase [Candidatus Nitrospinota bacterium M3_3B_026]
MSRKGALAYLNSLDFRGMRLGLERAELLLDRLGNPHRDFSVVHVAGTNGKGSTSGMISAILTQAGIRNGLYTSPHLETFRERIQVNGKMISQAAAVDLINEVRDAMESAAEPAARQVTYFEFLTAMAFLRFSVEKVRVAVVEVGMGGRYDSTNVVDPAVSVITSVAMDHRRHLGSSLKAIAGEKCGIIKKGRPVALGVRRADAAGVAEAVARKKGAPVWKILRDYTNRRRGATPRGERFDFRSKLGDIRDAEVGLAGRSQVDNASAAIMSVLLMRDEGFDIPEKAIRAGLAGARLPGRFEKFHDNPTVILDGAHNTRAASALRSTIIERFGPGRADIIFGAMVDKDYRRMLRTLRPAARAFHIYRPDVPRAAALEDMLAAARAGSAIPVKALSGPEGMLNLIGGAGKNRVFVVTGSFYTVGEVRSALRRFFRKNPAGKTNI